MNPWRVDLERVLALCDPRRTWPWSCNTPPAELVQALFAQVDEVPQPVGPDAAAEQHIGRILYLARHGGSDPIEIDVGIPSLHCSGPQWPVTDGNHRLWAATLRSETMIDVYVTGQLDHAQRLLGLRSAKSRRSVQRNNG